MLHLCIHFWRFALDLRCWVDLGVCCQWRGMLCSRIYKQMCTLAIWARSKTSLLVSFRVVVLLLLCHRKNLHNADDDTHPPKQTINQPGIFGGYTRWAKDVSCPTDEIPASAMLSDIDYAVHCSHSGTAGPVHLNLMYRENLAPDAGPPRGGDAPGGSGKSGAWERGCLASWRLSAWERCSDPLTRYARVGPSATLPSGLIDCLLSARRGVVIAGTLLSQCDRCGAIPRLWSRLPRFSVQCFSLSTLKVLRLFARNPEESST